METIKFNDANDIVVGVKLDDKQYKLRILWNYFGSFWSMHILDNNRNPLLCNVKLVPNFPLLLNKHCFNVPRGEFVVRSNQLELDRNSFKDGQATLIYLTESEWG